MTLETDTGCEIMKGENGFQTNPYCVAQHDNGMEVVFAIVKRLYDHQVVLNGMDKNGLRS
ncbi:MAG TPA: hypothetical protein DEF43_19605 [Chloroflexus aurantiacus]|jgi:hypothetical protein|nr:MAG: hypothetical protein D6716_05310 [Chloroflexota bacterium]HBW69309.1 hypothetical protein [Chloroflexus aurantiacus]